MDDPAATTHTSCELHVAAPVPAQNFAYIRVTKTKTDKIKTIEEANEVSEHVISHEFAELGYSHTGDDGVSFFDYKS